MVVVRGDGDPSRLRQDGATLSWGKRPPVDSAPVGRGTGQRDAGRSNRGRVVKRARLKPDSDSRPWSCGFVAYLDKRWQALYRMIDWFGWSPLRWARSPRVGSRVRRGEYEISGGTGRARAQAFDQPEQS